MLSRCLLMPTNSKIKNPFASIIYSIEGQIAQDNPDYFLSTWRDVKKECLNRILGLEKNGAKLNALSVDAPNDNVRSVIIDIHHTIDRSIYFTSQYWRAFYYFLTKNKLDKERWPLFGHEELLFALDLLSPSELAFLKEDAKKEWPNFFDDKKAVDLLYKSLQGDIVNLCRKRLHYLSRKDPAIYSLPDLVQQVNCAVTYTLRTQDHFVEHPNKMYRWALKCADNAILNIKEQAQCVKRGLSCYNVNMDIIDEAELPNLRLLDECDDALCLTSMIERATPKISTYLNVLFNTTHHPEFWSWFHENEPELAQREIYVEEHPEAVGPWVQRWLDLPTKELVNFLNTNLPTFITPNRRGFRKALAA